MLGRAVHVAGLLAHDDYCIPFANCSSRCSSAGGHPKPVTVHPAAGIVLHFSLPACFQSLRLLKFSVNKHCITFRADSRLKRDGPFYMAGIMMSAISTAMSAQITSWLGACTDRQEDHAIMHVPFQASEAP